MSDQEQHEGKQHPPYIDDSLLINSRLSEVERQQRDAKAEQRKHERSQRTTNWLLTVFTGLLFVTSVISDALLIRQTGISKESADAAKSAADTARDTLKINKDLTEGTNEAVCNISVDCRDLEKGICQLTFANIGHVAAKTVRAHVEFSLRDLPSNIQVGGSERLDFAQEELTPRIGAENPMYAPGHGDIYRPVDVPMLRVHKMEIESGKKALMINAAISYNNGFGSMRNTPYCGAIAFGRSGPPPSPNLTRMIVPCGGPFGIASFVEEQRKLNRAAQQQNQIQNQAR